MESLTSEVYMHDVEHMQTLIEENRLLREEIRVAREAAEITASLVVKQFEETEKILRRFQMANSQRKAVLNSASEISIIATNTDGIIHVINKAVKIDGSAYNPTADYSSKDETDYKKCHTIAVFNSGAIRRYEHGIEDPWADYDPDDDETPW